MRAMPLPIAPVGRTLSAALARDTVRPKLGQGAGRQIVDAVGGAERKTNQLNNPIDQARSSNS
jgi:hypothetical protein